MVSPKVLDDLLENRRRERVGREFDEMALGVGASQRKNVRQHLDRMVNEGLEPTAAEAIQEILFDEIDVDLRNRRAARLGDLEEGAYWADKFALTGELNQLIAAYVTWDEIGVLRDKFVPDEPEEPGVGHTSGNF